MIEVVGGGSTDVLKVDPISKAARVTMYDSAGNEIIQSLPIAIAMSNVTVVDNDLIGSLDVSAYKYVSIQLTGTWAGTVSFQGSNDNGTFYDVAVQNPRALATPYVTALSAVGLVKVPIIFKYLRVRVTAYTSGTVAGTAFGYKEENSTGQISSTGEVTISDTAGSIMGPLLTGLDGQKHLPVGTIQDVFISTANSTSVNLGAAQIFTGVSQSTKGFSSIDLTAECNEPLTIEIQQSHDGVEFDHGDTYYLAAGTETHRNFKAHGAFFRVRVTNTGSSETTHIHVNITLTPISEVLPSALTQAGSLKTALVESLPTGTNSIGDVDNLAKIGGVAVSMGGGVSDAGTQRVSIASDEPIALAAGSTTIGSLDNVAKLGGVAVSMGAGVVDAGTQRVVLPDNPTLYTDFYVTGVGAVDVNSRMIQTGACILKAAVFTSYAATPRHIKLYDTSTTPTAGASTPVLVLTRASSGNNSYPLPEGGFPFANGIGMTFVQGAANNNATGTATVDGSLTAIFT
jgi:hypothetical protein